MSIQVRRRREAAAFLATYVGAQGELLVDTSNNRVQVHDGTTPGGWPAATVGDLPGRNALINANFAVNQRGYASGAALAAGAYGHDRWKAGSGGCTCAFTQATPDTTVTITAGTLVQAVDIGNVYASAFWLSWTGTAPARVWQGSASGTFAAGAKTTVGGVAVNALLVTGLATGTVTNVEFGTGTLGLVQFEAALPNAGPTRFERRQGEQALCLRYFQRLGATTSSIYKKFGTTFALNGSSVAVPLLNMAPMRATPTLTTGGTFCLYGSGNTIFAVSGMVIDMADPQAVSALALIDTSNDSLTIGAAYGMQAYGDPNARIDLSAEL